MISLYIGHQYALAYCLTNENPYVLVTNYWAHKYTYVIRWEGFCEKV